jgi:hypothetical protein
VKSACPIKESSPTTKTREASKPRLSLINFVALKQVKRKNENSATFKSLQIRYNMRYYLRVKKGFPLT